MSTSTTGLGAAPRAAGASGRPSRARAARWWAVHLGVLAVGLVALAVGAGLGLRHYAVEGWGPPAVVGLLLLAGGLVCSGWATLRLLAALRRRWWPLALALLLVATYISLWTLGQAVAASYAPRPELGGRTPADLELAYRDVTFPSSDGVDLAGWYVPTRNGAAVALLHGAGSTRSDVLGQAAVLARHGYGVLLFDARGHGESAGRGMDFGWYGTADVSGAVDFLTRQPDVSPDRVGLVGLSMGGEEAIGAAGTGRADRRGGGRGRHRPGRGRQGLPHGVRRPRQTCSSASTRSPTGSPTC